MDGASRVNGTYLEGHANDAVDREYVFGIPDDKVDQFIATQTRYLGRQSDQEKNAVQAKIEKIDD